MPAFTPAASGDRAARDIESLQTSEYASASLDALNGILVELRVISHILNNGLNNNDNLDQLRSVFISVQQ